MKILQIENREFSKNLFFDPKKTFFSENYLFSAIFSVFSKSRFFGVWGGLRVSKPSIRSSNILGKMVLSFFEPKKGQLLREHSGVKKAHHLTYISDPAKNRVKKQLHWLLNYINCSLTVDIYGIQIKYRSEIQPVNLSKMQPKPNYGYIKHTVQKYIQSETCICCEHFLHSN